MKLWMKAVVIAAPALQCAAQGFGPPVVPGSQHRHEEERGFDVRRHISRGAFTEAYFSTDPAAGESQYLIELDRQHYFSGRDGPSVPLEGIHAYVTDLRGDGGLIVWISDPDATISVWSAGDGRGGLHQLFLRPIAVDDPASCRSIYTDRSTGLGRLIVVVSSPNAHKSFTIRLVRYETDPT